MSDRYVVRVINEKGKITGDYFAKYVTDEYIEGCLFSVFKFVEQNYISKPNGYELGISVISFYFSSQINGTLIENGRYWDPCNLDGFYVVDFQQKKIYYGSIGQKICGIPEQNALQSARKKYEQYSQQDDYAGSDYQNAQNNFEQMVKKMISPFIEGRYPQYDKCTDGMKVIYDFSSDYPQPPSSLRIERIANNIMKKADILSEGSNDAVNEMINYWQENLSKDLRLVFYSDGGNYQAYVQFVINNGNPYLQYYLADQSDIMRTVRMNKQIFVNNVRELKLALVQVKNTLSMDLDKAYKEFSGELDKIILNKKNQQNKLVEDYKMTRKFILDLI